MHQLQRLAIGAILLPIALTTTTSVSVAQEWNDCHSTAPQKRCRWRLCKEPPRGRVAYSFTAVVNQDNPIDTELQSRSEEFDERLSAMETQMNDVLTEFRVLMQVLAEEPHQAPKDEASGGLEGGGQVGRLHQNRSIVPPPAPRALGQKDVVDSFLR